MRQVKKSPQDAGLIYMHLTGGIYSHSMVYKKSI